MSKNENAQRDVGTSKGQNQKSVADIVAQYIKPTRAKDMESIKTQWLIDGLLLKESLVMIYAKAGSGKSLMALALANYLLQTNKVDNVIYLDGDNTSNSLKERGLDFIFGVENLQYCFVDSENRKGINTIFDEMQKATIKQNTLLIIDSIRDFINCDMKDDLGVMHFLNKLKDLRERGVTIIFLHHQPKQYGDNNKIYKGATAFEDSVDESYFLSQETEHAKLLSAKLEYNEILFSLEPQKRRNKTKLHAIAIKIDNGISIRFLNKYIFLGKNEKEIITIKILIGLISKEENGITQNDLVKEAIKFANANYYEMVGKNAIWNLLNEYDGKLFISQKGGLLNKKIYKPIKNMDYKNIHL